MASIMPVPLQQYIASLDNSCLPRILQICTGIYFQGSVYELSGSEVCFSSGDVVKIIKLELQFICCESVDGEMKFELPVDHKGLFQLVPEDMPYRTVEEMVRLRPLGLDSSLPFAFTNSCDMTLENYTVRAGTVLTVLPSGSHESRDYLRCLMAGQQEASAEVCIPISSRGEFRVCAGEDRFTVQEIISSAGLCNQRFRFVNNATSENTLFLSPVYKIHAIMSLRRTMFSFSSSLEVDVIDITDQCKDKSFLTPLSLTEVLALPDDSLPTVVEVLEAPRSHSLLKPTWLPDLRVNSHLIFHRKGPELMFLMSNCKRRAGRQYFLVSHRYGGRFRRRPREFHSVYELHVASLQAPGLRVSVTKTWEEEDDSLPALGVGEQLEIVGFVSVERPCKGSKKKEMTEALLCLHYQVMEDEDDSGDEKVEEHREVHLPLFMQGHFVEVLSTTKKFSLGGLGDKFTLPLDVKVANCDTDLECDPLMGLSLLRIEGTMLEPTIHASFLNKPNCGFNIPTKRFEMSVSLTNDALPCPIGEPLKCHVVTVTEVTEAFYCEFVKHGDLNTMAPPPRPPKRSTPCSKNSDGYKTTLKSHKSRSEPDASILGKGLEDLKLSSKQIHPVAPVPLGSGSPCYPPIPPKPGTVHGSRTQPNTYIKIRPSKKKALLDSNEEHDYEDLN